MASNLFKFPIQTFKATKPSTPLPLSKTLFPSLSIPLQQQQEHSHLSYSPQKLLQKSNFHSLNIQSSLSSYTPPTTKEEAILQAKTCLSTTLEKPLNNPRLAGKLKKQKQPRFRVEIPVVDDSAESLAQLAFEVLGDLPIRRKGTPVKILILWPNPTLTEVAAKAFEPNSSSQIEHMDVSSVTNDYTRFLNSGDVVVFLAPEASQIDVIKTVTDGLYPKPVVIFNPRWGFEEEGNFGELGDFVGSFEVVYSFLGLEVRGILSQRKGVVFKCVRDGVLSGERWAVLVEEEGELKVISKFTKRPSIGEVENVLYNLMAVNSPITKSAKFLKDLVSNVTGKNYADINVGAGWECSVAENFTAGNPFKTNRDNLLTSLASNGPGTGFYKATSSRNSNKLYGLIQCRGDISAIDCANCTKEATQVALHDCPNSKMVQVWFKWCTLKYSNEKFFGTWDKSSVAITNGTDFEDPAVVSQGLVFMGRLASTAPYQPLMFQKAILEVGDKGKRYGMVQCRRDLSRSDCEKCLDQELVTFGTTIESIRRWEIYGTSCNLLYDDYQFFFGNISMTASKGAKIYSWNGLGVAVMIVMMLIW
ncbi:hypothetical protein HHK36_005550 [Tetracentron sinense]|uniref:Gnk2-homologous domain-containing protein n=1 Tax=Tetracentron sinense TaxID=13715 RepID=A0A835DQS8_TETSI|nr:hypothetical protein HHK36_005550 [Tetracentron sinense]